MSSALLASARSLAAEREPAFCEGCQRNVLLAELHGGYKLCDRPWHSGTYSTSAGWSCCYERKKRGPTCSTFYCLHTDPPDT